MTILTAIDRWSYAGAGTTGPFATTRKILDSSDVAVRILDTASGAVLSTLVLDVDYTVTDVGNPNGAQVRTTAAVAGGTTLLIVGQPALTQPSDFIGQADFKPKRHEDAYDRLANQVLWLQDQLNRAVLSPVEDSAVLGKLPRKSLRVGLYQAFDVNGDPVASIGTGNDTALRTDLANGTAGPGSALVAIKRTAAELAAGVTPTNYAIDPTFFDPRRYGAVGDGVTNDATALANALLVAGVNGGTIKLPAGYTFFCTSNLTVPVGINTAVDIEGSSWTHGGLKFSSASVTTGLTYTGSSYDYCGEIRNLRIYCVSNAVRGVTFSNVNHPRISRCAIHGAAGAGVLYSVTLMGLLSHTMVASCGSATEGSVEVVGAGSTTFKWDHSRISGGNTTVGGLLIDKTSNITIIGGNIESSGCPIKIGSKADAATGCVGGIIHTIDLENPGNNPFIDLGSGMSASARVNSFDIRGCNGTASGATQIDYAVRINQGMSICFGPNNWGQAGTPVSTYELTSTGNFGIHIEPHRNLFGLSYPWVRSNAVQIKAAGPHLDWDLIGPHEGLSSQSTNLSGATPSVLISATQGGYYGHFLMNNGGATTVTALTGGERGMHITIYAPNGNTTLTQSTVTADQFSTLAAANLVMGAIHAYEFVHNGTLWVQL